MRNTQDYLSVYIEPHLTHLELSTQTTLRILLNEIGKENKYYVTGSKIITLASGGKITTLAIRDQMDQTEIRRIIHAIQDHLVKTEANNRLDDITVIMAQRQHGSVSGMSADGQKLIQKIHPFEKTLCA